MRDGAATLSASGLVLYANRRFAELLSRSREAVVGAPLARFVAGGLEYVYDQLAGKVRVYAPTTGKPIAALSAGTGHWSSVAIANGHLVVGQGNADSHPTGGGILNIWSVGS